MSVSESYQKLGLESNVSYETVKAAHRRLIKRFHPDLYFNNKEAAAIAEEETKKINLALEAIRNHLSSVIAEQKGAQIKQAYKAHHDRYFSADYSNQASYSNGEEDSLSGRVVHAAKNTVNYICSKSYLITGVMAVYVCVVRLKQSTAGEILDLNILGNLVSGIMPF